MPLSAGDLAATLRPASGGRIASLSHRGCDILVPMRGEIEDPLFWPKAGCYPLIPFSNRIRNGRFPFAGTNIALPAHPSCPPHALHGFAQARRWTAERLGEGEAIMRYTHAPDEWPWAFAAEQRLRLAPDALEVELLVESRDDRPMPVGLGLHPYLAVRPGDRIAFAAGVEWEQDEAGCGVAARALGAGRHYDAAHGSAPVTRYFADWTGEATLLRSDGLTVTVASTDLGHFVFHVPAGGAYACMEPVSHVADAFNLAAAGMAGTGLRTLAAGERMQASIRIRVT